MNNSENSNITRSELIELLNQDLSREVRAVSGYANSSRHFNDMSQAEISGFLKVHAEEELTHAMTIAAQIDTLGGAPVISEPPAIGQGETGDLLQCELNYELASISEYETRVKQCEALGEHSVAAFIRKILAQDLEHFSRLAVVLKNTEAYHKGEVTTTNLP